MPDTPTFALISRQIASTLASQEPAPGGVDVGAITEQLRAIWNARGAADLKTIESELAQIGVKATAHLRDTLGSALQALDR
jgi:hypothetical protein